MSTGELVLVESNTTGTGRDFCAAARARGLRPVVLVRDPDRYPYLAEDDVSHVVVDTTDEHAVHRVVAALPGPIAGVTTSSELFVARSAALARDLGLPHPSPEAVARARDKVAMRATLRAAGCPGPAHARATSADELVAAVRRLGAPVVVKPVHGTGSQGVRLVREPSDLEPVADTPLLVESYLDGPEFSVETFDRRAVAVVAKYLSAPPHFVETGHDLPAPPQVRGALAEAALAALDALGLGWGAAHVEVRLTATGPCVVEVNPRLAGGMIPTALRAATGIDLVDAVVARAIGAPVRTAAVRDDAAAIRFAVADRSGTVEAVTGVAEARRMPGVADVGVRAPAGSTITVRHDFRDRLATVVATAPDVATAAARASAARDVLGWRWYSTN